MKTILITLLVLAVAGAAVWVGTKFFGLAKDEDKDGIPDQVEDAAKEVKRRAKRVAEEAKDVVEDVKAAVNQAKDIKKAAQGNRRRGRKPNQGGGGTSTPKNKGYYGN